MRLAGHEWDPAVTKVQIALAKVLAAAKDGDGKAASAATALLLRQPVPPRAVAMIIDAVVNLDDRDFAAVAARLAILADLPPPMRVNAAWRLALAGFTAEAMATLLADPQMLTEPRFVLRSIVVLREVRGRGTPGALVTDQAAALLRRLLPAEDPPFVASPHVFGGETDDAPRMPGDPVVLHAAPDLPEILLTDTEAAIATFERLAKAAKPPEVRMLTDVFVNRTGQIWNREGRVFRAYNKVISPESRAAEATAPEIADAALATETHNNIFHWFAEWFPALAWRLGGAGGDVPILVRDDAARYVRESLELGADRPIPIETAGDAVFVRRLHLADTRLVLLARRGLAAPLYARVRDRAKARTQAFTPRPVYISRRDTPRRPLVNELELEAALRSRGFDILTMSSLPFAEQIARIDAADTVVGAHGAGFTLLAAASPGRDVVEIVPAVRGDMPNRVNMANISRMAGHRHHLWLERMPAANGGKWSAPLEPVLALIDRLREGRP
jgi:capsular polysaccharide biosynthesis protein